MDGHRPIEKHDGKPEECIRCNPILARQAQADYVARWRAEHARGTWGEIWACPLCGKAIQTTVEGASYHPHDVEAHQTMHGPDWSAYQSLSTGG